MPHSVDRFLTTHTGSLPRPDDLIEMMYAKEEGKPVDREALAQRIRSSVGEVVGKQRKAGLDIVNDGEMSKPSYATYVKDRLSGFGGTSNSFVYQDLVEFPNMAKRVFGDPGRSRRKTPACNGPIAVADPDAVRRDVDNLKAAVGEGGAQRAFMTAASPGVISLFFRNDYYPSESAYLAAISDAMRPEYEAIVAAGFDLQIDCPDLAMGRHIQYANLELSEFRKRAAEHVEALNGALANIPAERVRMHLCWGNYEGPHHCDVPLADIVDVVLSAKPAGAVARSGQSAPRARVGGVRDDEAAGRQGADSRRHRIQIELHRASASDRQPDQQLRQARRPGERDRRQRLRLRHLGRPGRGRPGHRLGEIRRAGRGRAHRERAVLALMDIVERAPACARRAARRATRPML